MRLTFVLVIIASLASVNAAADIARPTQTPKICPIRCPDGFVVKSPCGAVYIRDPCSDHQLPKKHCTHTCPDGWSYTDICGTVYIRDPCSDHQEKPKLCKRTCPDGYSWEEDCDIRYIQDPCVAGGHTSTAAVTEESKPTSVKLPDSEDGFGLCARKCQDGTVLTISCGVMFIQDPCVAGGHGRTVEGPKSSTETVATEEPKPTGVEPPNSKYGFGMCARTCQDGTVLTLNCGVVFIQDPCVAGGHGPTVEGPNRID